MLNPANMHRMLRDESGEAYLDMAMSLSRPHPDRPHELPGVKLGDEQSAADRRWSDAGLLALVGIGVEPGLSDVFARYAEDELFDEIDELGVRDGANLVVEGYEFAPSFSIWTTIEECLNPPVVFVCQNNQYAEYTTFAQGTSAAQITDRAIGYSMRAFHVNGNNPVEMYEAARLAVDAARTGGGPTLIEADTYRFRGHTPQDPMEYMPKEERAAAEAADPVPALRRRLLDAGIATEEQLKDLEDAHRAEIDDAFAFAEASPQPDLSELHTDLV